MKVIGFDPGTNTGYAVLDNGQLIDIGTIFLEKYGDTELERISGLVKVITKLIRKHNPDACVVEGQYIMYKTQGTITLIKYAGVIEAVLSYHNIPYDEIPPALVKKWFVGSGRADKKDIIEEAGLRFRRSFRGKSHEADAVALAWVYITKYERIVDVLSEREGKIL